MYTVVIAVPVRPAAVPISVLLVPVVIALPALAFQQLVLPCGLPLNPAGTFAIYTEAVSTKQSDKLFKI